MLTVGSLFAGYGGIELALSSVLDVRPAWFVEFDKAPSKVLAHHWPDVPNYGDVTTVDWSTVEPVDIITGGSPCQDLSHAGRRKGMTDGTRSNLWVEMREAIATIRPSLVCWENVRGAYSAAADSALEPCPGCVGSADGEPVLRALGRVLGDLSDLGYDAWWYGLRAADVGAAHGRFRIFVFAVPADSVGDTWRLLDGNRRAAPDARREPRLVPAEGHQPAVPVPACDGDPGRAGLTLLPTPTVSDSNGAGAHGDGGLDLRTAATLLPTPRATDGTKGGPNQRGSSGDLMLPSAVVPERWGQYAAAITRAEHAFGRPAPSPTEPGPKGAPRLSATFVEWHMGLPNGWVTDPAIWDGWTDTKGKPRTDSAIRNAAIKALGNGIVPQQMAAAFRAFLDDLWARVSGEVAA